MKKLMVTVGSLLAVIFMLFTLTGCPQKVSPSDKMLLDDPLAMQDSNEPAQTVGAGPVDTVGVADTADAEQSFDASFNDKTSFDDLNRAPANHIYYFSFNDSTVAPRYVRSIEAQAHYLLNHPKARLRLEGHTDERGSREYNISLGWERAKSVAWILKKKGVSSRQLVLVSYGKERPIDFNSNPSAWQKNRRVALVYERR